MNRRSFTVVLASFLLIAASSAVTSSAPAPRHFVFYGYERERITETAFVATPALVGAQLKYSWRELEPKRGAYDFSAIRHDLAVLKREGKQLFIQLQDISFVEAQHNLPDYILQEPAFHGGVAAQYAQAANDTSRRTFEEWVPRRWDPAVRARLVALVVAVAGEFDGKIAGINFAESSIDFEYTSKIPEGYTPAAYYGAMRDLMRSARAAFKKSDVLFYLNFMPGESLPEDDKGYLKGLYRLADSLGVGVGGPDLLPNRRYQQVHSLPLIAARGVRSVAGVAVQDGNLADVDRRTGKRVTVNELVAYATDPLHLDYMFWGTEEPYWSADVVPYLKSLRR